MTRSVVQRCHHDHVFETMPWRWRILIWGQSQLQFHPTDRTPIPDVHLAHLTGRWWRRQRCGEGTQHRDAHPPQKHHHQEANAHPDHSAKCDCEHNHAVIPRAVDNPSRPATAYIARISGRVMTVIMGPRGHKRQPLTPDTALAAPACKRSPPRRHGRQSKLCLMPAVGSAETFELSRGVR